MHIKFLNFDASLSIFSSNFNQFSCWSFSMLNLISFLRIQQQKCRWMPNYALLFLLALCSIEVQVCWWGTLLTFHIVIKHGNIVLCCRLIAGSFYDSDELLKAFMFSCLLEASTSFFPCKAIEFRQKLKMSGTRQPLERIANSAITVSLYPSIKLRSLRLRWCKRYVWTWKWFFLRAAAVSLALFGQYK